VQPSIRTMLSAFCAARDFRGSECLHANHYPGSDACNVKLTGKYYKCRFITPSGNIVIADSEYPGTAPFRHQWLLGQSGLFAVLSRLTAQAYLWFHFH
jgi:hypothetical protein